MFKYANGNNSTLNKHKQMEKENKTESGFS